MDSKPVIIISILWYCISPGLSQKTKEKTSVQQLVSQLADTAAVQEMHKGEIPVDNPPYQSADRNTYRMTWPEHITLG